MAAPKNPLYNKQGMTLNKAKRKSQSKTAVIALQTDLRALGYLAKGIDGDYGGGTEKAVKALQHDLLNNHGEGSDGSAPVAVSAYNKARVEDADGIVNQACAACISDILADDAFPKLPAADGNPPNDAKGRNSKAITTIEKMTSPKVPIPFLLAAFKQESGSSHFSVRKNDSYVTIGLDTNSNQKHVITSRGYGIGQYTIFHHPPRKGEVRDFINGVAKNVTKAVEELHEKFSRFVNGNTSGTKADDRIAEKGTGKLQVCKFSKDDPLYLRDCKQCMIDAGQKDVVMGTTKWHPNTSRTYQNTQYYKSAIYKDIPIRAKIPCDWAYAARRYNGSGQNSYHYQTIILRNVLEGE
jgi:peptidoglycan hydrolase-like protein with peptidoglycan-binding domain